MKTRKAALLLAIIISVLIFSTNIYAYPSEHKVNGFWSGWNYPLDDLCKDFSCKNPIENITFGFMSYYNVYNGFHYAQDFTNNKELNLSYEEGDPVYAMANGSIVKVRKTSGYGGGDTYNTFVVKYKYNDASNFIKDVYVLYAHVKNIKKDDDGNLYTTGIEKEIDTNISVTKGEKIGELNNFSPVHLHLSVMPDSLPGDYYDGYNNASQSKNGRVRPFNCWVNKNGTADWIKADGTQDSTNVNDEVFFDRHKSYHSAIDVALIIDSSGSMSWNDPLNLRKEAAKIFVDTAGNSDQIAIIDFDGDQTLLWYMQPLTKDRRGIKYAIDWIDSSGGTNISAGLLEGFNELSISAHPNKKAAVLLTDGEGYYNNEADYYANNGWPIYTVGLGYSTDVYLLAGIANQTGGKYFPLTDPAQLKKVYFEIATQISGGTSILSKEATLITGQSSNIFATVPAGQKTATFLTSWPGSDVSTALTTPSGRIIDANSKDADVYHAKGLTYELYRIDNPEAGEWNVSLFGVDLANGGEVIGLNVSVVGAPTPVDDTPPIISVLNPIEGKMYFNQLPVACNFTIEDPESGILEHSALLNGNPINNNDEMIFNTLGENTLTITATNNVKLRSEMTIKFSVCDFHWLPPIKHSKKSTVENGALVVKAGRTYPIKFTIKDKDGGFIIDPSVKVVVEGTTTKFLFGDSDDDVRINEFEGGEESNYIVNLHTNFKKWDYGLESGNKYFINVYFDNILAGKTMILIR